MSPPARSAHSLDSPASGALTILTVGPRALLIEVSDLETVRCYYAEARRRSDHGLLPAPVRDIVPGARTVLFDGLDDVAVFARDLLTWRPPAADDSSPRHVEVPTVYDGEDLKEVARMWDMTSAEAIATHSSCVHTVSFSGFAPGFPYISGLPATLAVPRRGRPRTQVPRGSVALAGEFTGIYPRRSPGGWQLIGRTALILWDPTAEPAATLSPGTRVTFSPQAS